MDQSLEKDLESLRLKEDERVWEEVDALEPADDVDAVADIEKVDDEIVVDENFLWLLSVVQGSSDQSFWSNQQPA